jgi:CBS-domain-containing membrane protein
MAELVRDVMSSDLVTVRVDDSLIDAAKAERWMPEAAVRRLPVVEARRPDDALLDR